MASATSLLMQRVWRWDQMASFTCWTGTDRFSERKLAGSWSESPIWELEGLWETILMLQAIWLFAMPVLWVIIPLKNRNYGLPCDLPVFPKSFFAAEDGTMSKSNHKRHRERGCKTNSIKIDVLKEALPTPRCVVRNCTGGVLTSNFRGLLPFGLLHDYLASIIIKLVRILW